MKIDSQITDTLVMVPPEHFKFNRQTMPTNDFQHISATNSQDRYKLKKIVMNEFETLVKLLRANGITVVLLQPQKSYITPDDVFPNNWFTHHSDKLVLYPMYAPNRRHERQPKRLLRLLATFDNKPTVVDFTKFENQGKFLEGTGSMVLDRINKVAFGIVCSRTDKALFTSWCTNMQYDSVFVHAESKPGNPIYHTNVFMSIGEKFVVYCPDAMPSIRDREKLKEIFNRLHKEIISITTDQMKQFCSNILQVKSTNGKRYIILSSTAVNAFADRQKKVLSTHGELLVVDIGTIEHIGGGGVRCMLGEIFVNQ